MFKFLIDGVQYKEPINWQDFSETIEYNYSSGVFAFKYSDKLTFTGEAFNYLYNIKRSSGFCYSASIEILQKCENYETIFKGTIYVASCRFNIKHRTVDVTIDDNNISAYVFNNKNIQVCPDCIEYGDHLSKNGINIGTGYGEVNVPRFFNPATGVYSGATAFTYRAHTIFTRIIQYITDDKVGFKSDYLDPTLPVSTVKDRVKYICVSLGEALRYDIGLGSSPPTGSFKVTFDQLFSNINKLYPLSIGIEVDGTGKPILRIEDSDYFRNQNSSITINSVDNLQEYIDVGLLFSKIKIGSESVEYDNSIHSFEPTPTLKFSEEEYFLSGQCNIDTYKDLYNTFIYDSNIIEEICYTNTSNSKYDDALFFIEVDLVEIPAFGYEVIKTLNTLNARYHYNDNLMNINVVLHNEFGSDVYYVDTSGTHLAQTNSGGAYYVNVFTFDSPISHQKYSTLKQNLTKYISFNDDATQQRKGWIRSINRRYFNGETKFELISNLNNS